MQDRRTSASIYVRVVKTVLGVLNTDTPTRQSQLPSKRIWLTHHSDIPPSTQHTAESTKFKVKINLKAVKDVHPMHISPTYLLDWFTANRNGDRHNESKESRRKELKNSFKTKKIRKL